MKRLVFGIIILVVGALAVIGGISQGDNPQGLFGGILFVVGGGIMIYYGSRYLQRKKTVTEIGLRMLREHEKIDAAYLARRVGISEVDVRLYIANSQSIGLIPFKADII